MFNRCGRLRPLDPAVVPDQVANAPDSRVNLTPASQAPLLALRAGWEPWLTGQSVPLIWEPDIPDEEAP